MDQSLFLGHDDCYRCHGEARLHYCLVVMDVAVTNVHVVTRTVVVMDAD